MSPYLVQLERRVAAQCAVVRANPTDQIARRCLTRLERELADGIAQWRATTTPRISRLQIQLGVLQIQLRKAVTLRERRRAGRRVLRASTALCAAKLEAGVPI